MKWVKYTGKERVTANKFGYVVYQNDDGVVNSIEIYKWRDWALLLGNRITHYLDEFDSPPSHSLEEQNVIKLCSDAYDSLVKNFDEGINPTAFTLGFKKGFKAATETYQKKNVLNHN